MKFKIEIPRKTNTPLEVIVYCNHIDPKQVDFKKKFKILSAGYDETNWKWQSTPEKDKNNA